MNIVDINKNNEEDIFYVMRAKEGDIDAISFLINKYSILVKSRAKSYFLVGADKEDLIQEGLIGLYKAIKDFSEEKSTSFLHFADICIRGQIITAVKASTRQKHIPLNSYVSLNRPIFEENSERTLNDIISNDIESDPESVIIGRENYINTEKKIFSSLSDFEERVFTMHLMGRSYQEIARELGKDKKAIDNAIQRIKRKLQKIFKDE